MPSRTHRTVMRTLRLRPGESAIIAGRAKAAGLSVSEFLRRAALGQRVRARRDQANRDLIYHLSKIGTNLNQLAHVANVARQVVAHDQLEELISALREVIDRLEA